jgi:hypothetical protein
VLVVVAVVLQGLVLQGLSAAWASAAELEIVAVVRSSDERHVSVLANVRGDSPPQPESFSISAANERLATRVVPVISDQLALALVVDASAAGSAALHSGLSGAASFLLQTPMATRTTIIADTSPPAVLAPLRVGAAEALSALTGIRGRGQRSTSEALILAAQKLGGPLARSPSGAVAGPRVVVLYTGASNAGGETATDLAERLRRAGVLLAVVTTGTDQRYWSSVATATGGVVVAARGAAIMPAFDQLAAALRTRYLISCPTPGQLPVRLSVRVNTAEETLTAEALLRSGDGALEPNAQPGSAGGRPRDGNTSMLLRLAAGTALLTTMLGATALLVARRSN